MFEAFLVTTSTEGLKPLGTAPQRSFELVTGTLRTRLSDAHAALFAEPVSTQFGDRFDWHATIPGKARPLSALAEAEAAEVRARLADLVGAIRAEGEALCASEQADDQRLGEALLNALEIPDEAAIWAVRTGDDGWQPVLVNWAWVRDEQRAVRGVLTGLDSRPAARRAPAMAAAAPALPPGAAGSAPTGRGPWWLLLLLGWLLLAALLAAIVYAVVAACGINGQGRLIFCPGPGPVASAEAAEMLALEDEILQLERRIAIADRACQPAPPPPPPPPEPAPDPEPEPERQSEIDRRLQDRGAQRGDLSFSLAWNSVDDLDLHISCPQGATISYRRTRACNGRLDVDANASQRRRDPVENVFFVAPAPGTYKVRVHLYANRTGGAKSFQLQVRQRDGSVQTLSGTVSPRSPNWTTTITIRG